jgi:hypothetical protein
MKNLISGFMSVQGLATPVYAAPSKRYQADPGK